MTEVIGLTFNLWTVIGGPRRIRRHLHWLCQCTCGNQRYVRPTRLQNGESLGCNPCALKRLWKARDAANVLVNGQRLTKSRWGTIVHGAMKGVRFYRTSSLQVRR